MKMLFVAALAVLPFTARASTETKINGEVFVTTKNGDAVKMSSVTVYAFPMSALDQFNTYNDTIQLPAPLAYGRTDSDGKFKLTVPATPEDYFIFAQATRTIAEPYPYAPRVEHWEWRVKSSDIADASALELENSNACAPCNKPIKIADQ